MFLYFMIFFEDEVMVCVGEVVVIWFEDEVFKFIVCVA